jgi:hypothetical protein
MRRLNKLHSNSILQVEEVIERREAWIEECVQKGLKDSSWRLKELQLLRMLRAISMNPTVDLDHESMLDSDEPIDYSSVKQF